MKVDDVVRALETVVGGGAAELRKFFGNLASKEDVESVAGGVSTIELQGVTGAESASHTIGISILLESLQDTSVVDPDNLIGVNVAIAGTIFKPIHVYSDSTSVNFVILNLTGSTIAESTEASILCFSKLLEQEPGL